MIQETLEAKLEFRKGRLADIFPLFDPSTLQEANEIMARRESMPKIRNEFFWTADFSMYTVEKGGAFLYLAQKKHNLIFRDIDNATAQLISTGNYIPPQEGINEVVAAATAGEALKTRISDLKLQKNNNQDAYGYFNVDPDNLDSLNESQRQLVNAIYGTSRSGTRVYVLDSEYVKKTLKGKRDSAIARASWLDWADYGSGFVAGGRDVDLAIIGLLEIVQYAGTFTMQRDLWQELCSYNNLELAYKKARKHKSTKCYVVNFEKDLQNNLLLLRSELLLHSYSPKPLVNFIVRDPKTRKISKSDFRDRIIHHALCNIIEPVFEKCFIYDCYANRKWKGTLKSLQRFDFFKRKVSKNNTRACYILKADIEHYFETVDHEILLRIIKKKIKDKRIIWLTKSILQNHKMWGGELSKGMPLGNLTSQFFANVYLSELDYFVKNVLKARYYIRYVDDFAILHKNNKNLEKYKDAINKFLIENLKIKLHPEKSKIIKLNRGINLLGYKTFYYHKLLRKSNKRKFERNFKEKLRQFEQKEASYEDCISSLQGWLGYAMWANTYKSRNALLKRISNIQ